MASVGRIAVGCLLSMLLASTAIAQEARGTIQGRVTDESGGVVPGARVDVTNVATGVVTDTTSNDQGNFRVPFLIPGRYRVAASLEGFGRFQSPDITVHVADVLTVDAILPAGQVTDEVTVSAAPIAIDRSSASLGQVVDARRIAELPIREGSAVELVILAPGVANTTNLRSRKAAFNNGLSQFSSDGAGEKRNDFTIDGVANVAGDRVAYSPPSAAVEEFKIQTSTYDAGIGNAMGAAVNVVTKSGTNRLTGQAYEWFRGSGLDTQDFFDKAAKRPKRDYTDNRFGVAVGGPILRNRTFYFANVEVNPFEVPTPAVLTVPTERMRSGDFSELLALGPQYQIYDPATTRPHPTQAGRFIRDPFPGNIIPGSRISPIARRILDYYPLPNQAGTLDGGNNYVNPTSVADEMYYTVTTRVDHSLSSRHRIYGRYSWDFWEESKNNLFDNAATGIILNRKNRVLGIDDAFTWRNNLLTNVRAGYTRQLFPERRQSQGFDVAGLGFSPALTGLVDPAQATFPNVSIGGYTPLGTWESGDGFFTTDVYNANASLMWLLGNHNIKFGTEYRHYVEHASRYPTAVSPTLTFSNQWTRGPIDNAAGAPRGQELASFMLGNLTGGSMSRAADYTEKSGVLVVLRAQRLARSQQPHGEPRAALRIRVAPDRVARPDDQRLRRGGGAADQRRGRGGVCAVADCGAAGAGVPGSRRRALPRYRRATAGVVGRPQQLHAARRVLVAAVHADGGAGWLRALLRRARLEPNQRQSARILAGHVGRALAGQRPDVHCHARQPVSGRAARSGRQRPRRLHQRRAERVVPVRRRGQHATHPPLVARDAAGAARPADCGGHLRRWAFGEPAGGPRPQRRAGAVLLHIAGARQHHQQLPDAAGGQPAGRPAADHWTERRHGRAQPAAPSLPAFHGSVGAGNCRTVGLQGAAGAPRATDGRRRHGAGRLHLVEDDDGNASISMPSTPSCTA